MRFFYLFSLCLALAAAPAAVAQNAGGRGQGANWVAAPDAPAREFGVYHFRRGFDLPAKPAAFAIRVTADNRYKLYVNGQLASLGPADSNVDLRPRDRTAVRPEDLPEPEDPGEHVATIWVFGTNHLRLDTHTVWCWETR